MSDDALILDEQQERDAQKCAATTSGASADFSTPGAGKTVVALRIAQLRGAQQILVIAPLGTRLSWFDTACRIGIDLPFYWVQNTKAGQQAMVRLQFGEAGVYFIGPEYATRLAWDTLTDKNGDVIRNDKGKPIKKRNEFWNSITPDVLIIDEVHEGTANSRSDRHKVYASMSAGHIHALSGTPHGNTFDGIYPVTKILWPDHVPSNAAEFKRKYCKTEFDPFAWDKMKVVGELNEGAYFASLPCVVRREWKYEGSIDEETVYVELSAAQRKAYDELEKHMATVIEGDPFVVEFPSTLHIRLRQATLGVFCIEDDGSVGFADNCKSTKLDALMGRILPKDFHNEPALLFTDSKRFAYVTVARINREYGDGSAELYSGDQSNAERMAIRERFGSGETKYVVVVIKAGGTGLDGFQHATRNMCFISRDYARIKNEQANARVVRRGQGDLVRIRHIIAVNTADSGILSRHISDAVAMNRSMRLEK
jgi:hypothetical protein